MSSRRTDMYYSPPSDPLKLVSAQVTGLTPGTVVRNVEMVGSPAGAWTTWQDSSRRSMLEESRDLNRRCSEALTPVTTSMPTWTTTSVLLSSSTSSVAVDRRWSDRVIYTRAGMSWSTATTTSVLGPFHCKPIAGGSRENIEEPSSSSWTRLERTHTRTAVDSYDSRVARGWDPHPEIVLASPIGTSLDVRLRSVDPTSPLLYV